MKNLAKALIQAQKEIKGVEKNLNVGAGNSSYKGVSDYDVKQTVRKAMNNNNLVILPINIDSKVDRSVWTESTNYGEKRKSQVFVEVKAKYLLLHESGESIEIEGVGHGIDSQDKAIGKASTYALKFALLYTFLIPTGDIDDTDKSHSDNVDVALPRLTDERFNKAIELIKVGEYDKSKLFESYSFTPEQMLTISELESEVKEDIEFESKEKQTSSEEVKEEPLTTENPLQKKVSETVSENFTDELIEARNKHKELFGRFPSKKMDEETINEKINKRLNEISEATVEVVGDTSEEVVVIEATVIENESEDTKEGLYDTMMNNYISDAEGYIELPELITFAKKVLQEWDGIASDSKIKEFKDKCNGIATTLKG